MTRDPASSPPRPELTFLRHRGKPRPVVSAVSDFISGRAPHPPHHQPHLAPHPEPSPPPTPATSSLDLSAPPTPAARPAPTAPPARAAATPAAPPTPATSSLDLSASPTPAARPAPTAPPAWASASSLDLSDVPVPEPAPAAAPPRVPRTPVHQDRRVRAGGHHLLGITEPTVTLTRVQSGIGQLEIEAVCSRSVGDLHVGAAYQLRGGVASTVQYFDGSRFAPSSRRPVIVAGRNEYEHLRIDLRRARDLDRLAVYAFSESRSELSWGGTLVVTTFGGARIELPLETLHPGRMAVLLSIYNLNGEFVVRAEMETILEGDIREAARAYGYDRITWRDDRSPVD